MFEFWLDITDAPEYEVSNTGMVRNRRTGRILKYHLDRPGGYPRVNINGRHRYIHRLVADRFFGGNHDNTKVIHKDGDKFNNTISNLQLVDRY